MTETYDYERIALIGQMSPEFPYSAWQMSCHSRLCSQIWFQSRFRPKSKCDTYPLLECQSLSDTVVTPMKLFHGK
jgi:hypothetical protein